MIAFLLLHFATSRNIFNECILFEVCIVYCIAWINSYVNLPIPRTPTNFQSANL